jgi:hypothetical protein
MDELSVSKAELFRRGAAVLLGAFFITWPALYNGYPLLYPDSITYLESGRAVGRALFLHTFSGYYGMRSFVYSLGILPLHLNVTPWPIVALHALLAAYVIWLMMRSILSRGLTSRYLLLVALLSLLTGLSWYADLIMPDILGPVAYLSVFLLVFARETLSRAEHITVGRLVGDRIPRHAFDGCGRAVRSSGAAAGVSATLNAATLKGGSRSVRRRPVGIVCSRGPAHLPVRRALAQRRAAAIFDGPYDRRRPWPLVLEPTLRRSEPGDLRLHSIFSRRHDRGCLG